MDLKTQNACAAELFEKCLDLLDRKGKDYTPNDVAFQEVVKTAEDLKLSVETVLWIYLQKHLTAIKRYAWSHAVESEPIGERIVDAINYLALLYVFVTSEKEILSDCTRP